MQDEARLRLPVERSVEVVRDELDQLSARQVGR